jgi:hypothetical protein
MVEAGTTKLEDFSPESGKKETAILSKTGKSNESVGSNQNIN